jgi:hypothetical protein
MRFDVCLASNWEYDSDFIRLLDSACAARGLSLLTLTPRTLADSLSRLASGEAGFSLLLDRASEADPTYLPLVEIAKSTGARRLNPRELADRAYDKAAMQSVFDEAGIRTPRTMILPSYFTQPQLPPIDTSPLDGRFAVKPALGGGGEGVVTELCTLEQVQIARQQFPEQQYLLQAHVTPTTLDSLPAWFRVIYCLGEIHPCFWDTTTHVYTPVPAGAIQRDYPKCGYTLGGHTDPPQQFDSSQLWNLRQITEQIARLCRLELFSTEIALTEENQFLVVDYVNDPIDLRLKSNAKDGVPDEIVERIAAQIAEETQKNQVS